MEKARRVLIVATAELGSAALQELVDEDAETMVVVPVTKQSPLQWLANDDDRARSVAERAAARLAEDAPGRPLAAEAGDPDPVLAIEDAVRSFAPDEIVLVRHAPADAGWLERRASLARLAAPRGVELREVTVNADGTVEVG